MKRSQMVIAVKTLKVKKIGQISDDAFEDIIQSDFFMYLPFKIAKMGVLGEAFLHLREGQNSKIFSLRCRYARVAPLKLRSGK